MNNNVSKAGKAIGWTYMHEGFTGSPKNVFWMTKDGKPVFDWEPDKDIGDCLPVLAALTDEEMAILCMAVGVFPACPKPDFLLALLAAGPERVLDKAVSLLDSRHR